MERIMNNVVLRAIFILKFSPKRNSFPQRILARTFSCAERSA